MLEIARQPAFLRSAGVAILTAALSFSPSARAQSFSIPTPDSGASAITAGPDGALWFTEENANQIGRITTAGVITEFPLPTARALSSSITAGPDGALWFTEPANDLIGRITTAGVITKEFPIPSQNGPGGITAGPDGALWFTEGFASKIGRITTAGVVTNEYPTLTAKSGPSIITAGPDGALWFTENDASKIGRITTAGVVTEFPTPTPNSDPVGITAGPDGALWFTEAADNKIGRITTAGVITNEFSVPTAGTNPTDITAGPDGALWLTEHGNALKIARLDTSGGFTEFPVASFPVVITAGPGDGAMWYLGSLNDIDRLIPPAATSPLFAAVLPASRSVEVGSTATAFVTILNADAGPVPSPVVGCGIAPVTSVPASFVYQTTDPTTNALTGTPNTPATISVGGSQTFVVAFTANAPMVPTNVVLGFGCNNTPAAATIVGINTLLLTFSATPVPDIVALAASGDPGILDVSSTTNTGVFAVATVNVGATGAITATADTGAATLPVTLTLCQTVPATGACMGAQAASVTTTINANATPTFGVFAVSSGNVAFDAANNRVFVRFTDADGVTRGSTSVAVRTK